MMLLQVRFYSPLSLLLLLKGGADDTEFFVRVLLQTPGSFVFVYTLAIRPGVDFTGWAPYFVTGILQGTLLILCLIFKRRQKKIGVDDWGNKLVVKGGGATSGEGGESERERSRLLG
jgi:hypothetical protein